MEAEKQLKSIFSVRNRIVYFISGVCCIVASFLPYYSFYYKNYFVTIKGIDVINDLKTLWVYEDKESILVLLLFILPFYVLILGIIYLFRSFVISYKIEKINYRIFKGIKTITVTLTILWVSAVFLSLTFAESSHDLSLVLRNIQFGFYLFALSEIFKFFLEFTVEDTDSVLDTIKSEENTNDYIEEDNEINIPAFKNGLIENLKYYIHNGDSQEGPFEIHELKNKIKETDYVWKKGMDKWIKASDEPALRIIFSDLPPTFRTN